MARVTLFAIVEGQTENAVLNKLMAPYLGARGIDLHCPIVTVGAGRGGVKWLRFDELADQIQRHLSDRRQPYVTTFFDYYGLPTSQSKGWEFIAQAKAQAGIRGLEATAQDIEKQLHTLSLTGTDLPNATNRFIPYIQLHELESLFFAEPAKMAEIFESPPLKNRFAKIVSDAGGCERINDSPQTAPSKRIESLYSGYRKGRSEFAHGPRLADKLDLPTVRAACPRFNGWLSSIEKLAPSP